VSLATTTNADAAAANVLHAEDDWIWIRDDSRTRPGLMSPESRINRYHLHSTVPWLSRTPVDSMSCSFFNVVVGPLLP
jgi:hypothetical protein